MATHHVHIQYALTGNTDILRRSIHNLGRLLIFADSDGSVGRGDVDMLLFDGVGLLSLYHILQVFLLIVEVDGKIEGKEERGRW